MSEKRNCLFCGNAASIESHLSNWEVWNCPQCGGFEVNTDDYDPDNFDPPAKPPINDDNKHIIAGYLYRRGKKGKIRLVTDDASLDDPELRIAAVTVNHIISESPKTTMQRLESLLLFLYLKNNEIGYKFETVTPAACYAKSPGEVKGMFWKLCQLDWLELFPDDLAEITVSGIMRAEELLSTNIGSKKVFVAMGFKDDLLEAYEQAIKPACSACGFDAFIISDKEHNNDIVDEITVALTTSRFVIADLTYDNPGAYAEAGFARGEKREVIQCVKAEWLNAKDSEGNPVHRLHFDFSHYNTIIWRDPADLARKLKARIRSTIDGAKLED